MKVKSHSAIYCLRIITLRQTELCSGKKKTNQTSSYGFHKKNQLKCYTVLAQMWKWKGLSLHDKWPNYFITCYVQAHVISCIRSAAGSSVCIRTLIPRLRNIYTSIWIPEIFLVSLLGSIKHLQHGENQDGTIWCVAQSINQSINRTLMQYSQSIEQSVSSTLAVQYIDITTIIGISCVETVNRCPSIAAPYHSVSRNCLFCSNKNIISGTCEHKRYVTQLYLLKGPIHFKLNCAV